MKRLLLIALVFYMAPLFCQITITQSAMPASGDTVRYSTASVTGVSIGTKGANQSWDYSTLTSTGQDLYHFLSANKTPYAFYFANQIGQKTADSLGAGPLMFKNIYSFSTKSSSVYKTDGLGYSVSGIPLGSNYSDPDEVYQFPLDYNDSDVSTFRFKFSIPGQTAFTFVQAGKRTNVVDGWGSIKTPYKTYASVLRVKTIVDEVDSLITSIVKLPIPRKQVIYKWLSLTEHIPVLEITGTEAAGVFTATQIRYRDKYNGLESPFKPHAGFTVDKTKGVVKVDTFKFTNGSMLATNFQWQITPANGSAVFVKTTTAATRNPSIIFTKQGTYTVSLIASNTFGTDDTTVIDMITVTDPNDGVNNTKSKYFSQIYPNPASNRISSFVSLFGVDANTEVKIFSVDGKLIMETRLENSYLLNISGLNPGLYLVVFQHQGLSAVSKLIKE